MPALTSFEASRLEDCVAARHGPHPTGETLLTGRLPAATSPPRNPVQKTTIVQRLQSGAGYRIRTCDPVITNHTSVESLDFLSFPQRSKTPLRQSLPRILCFLQVPWS
jgi:hypothetical protein